MAKNIDFPLVLEPTKGRWVQRVKFPNGDKKMVWLAILRPFFWIHMEEERNKRLFRHYSFLFIVL